MRLSSALSAPQRSLDSSLEASKEEDSEAEVLAMIVCTECLAAEGVPA
jgi:hypothetical protein